MNDTENSKFNKELHYHSEVRVHLPCCAFEYKMGESNIYLGDYTLFLTNSLNIFVPFGHLIY